MTVLEISSKLMSEISLICKDYNITKVKDILNYNLRGGKLTRYQILSHVANNGNEKVTEFDKDIVGFIIEAFHASFLMSDDIVDNSTMRRDKPCFYFRRKMMTLRDSRFLISLIYQLIKRLNLKIKKVIEKCFFETCLGQTIDTKNKVRDECSFSLYKRICELKTSSYTVYMPMACGYILGGRKCPDYLEEFTNIIGLIYQMNDDYLNFFPEKTKKSFTDLEEFKLTYFTSKLGDCFKEVQELAAMEKNEEELDVKEFNKDLDMFFNKKAVPASIEKWIRSYFDKYFIHKEELVMKSRDMIHKEDEKDLFFLYDILKKYELK
ncbi:farnesyl pyrophosphate synthase [Vairimorpha necatrix]|uniref:Farnesyl pyrophosphate synthase n=1 Tax=Vairimorpha necatrix TaxID=6039 RepID=A0AAX4J9W2_9MICR